MITYSVKITDKGQVTLPKEVREALQTDVISFEIKENTILIKPVHSVAGALKAYRREVGSFEEARHKAWNEGIDDDGI